MKQKISFSQSSNSYQVNAPLTSSITPAAPILSTSRIGGSRVTQRVLPGTSVINKLADSRFNAAGSLLNSGTVSALPASTLHKETPRFTTSRVNTVGVVVPPYLEEKITTFDTSAIKPQPYLVSGPVYTLAEKSSAVSAVTVPITRTVAPAYQFLNYQQPTRVTQYQQQYQQQHQHQQQNLMETHQSQRPVYQKLKKSKRQQEQQFVPTYQQPPKPNKCSCLPLWILLGLLGLAGLVLGLLFGLGVIKLGGGGGGTNPEMNVHKIPEGVYKDPVIVPPNANININNSTDFKIPPAGPSGTLVNPVQVRPITDFNIQGPQGNSTNPVVVQPVKPATDYRIPTAGPSGTLVNPVQVKPVTDLSVIPQGPEGSFKDPVLVQPKSFNIQRNIAFQPNYISAIQTSPVPIGYVNGAYTYTQPTDATIQPLTTSPVVVQPTNLSPYLIVTPKGYHVHPQASSPNAQHSVVSNLDYY